MGCPSSAVPLILVVDDEALLRLDAIDFLNDAGFHTIEARSGEEALAVLEGNPEITVVFTDINMPGPLDGIGLAAAVGDRWPDVQVILASGRTVPTAGEIPAHGHFVTKPYTPEAITCLVKSGS